MLIIYLYWCSCQFVVTANGDYSSYLTNADMLVDWKLIEQIVSCFHYNSLILLQWKIWKIFLHIYYYWCILIKSLIKVVVDLFPEITQFGKSLLSYLFGFTSRGQNDSLWSCLLLALYSPLLTLLSGNRQLQMSDLRWIFA